MESNSGLSHCCHHDKHYEWCTDYQKRLDYIKTNKPANEQELRLRLFKIIPLDRLPPSLDEAFHSYDEAGKAYNEALEACDEAGKAYDEAGKAYDEAGKACDEAVKACEPELAKLHDELFPDCTWNETKHSIF